MPCVILIIIILQQN